MQAGSNESRISELTSSFAPRSGSKTPRCTSSIRPIILCTTSGFSAATSQCSVSSSITYSNIHDTYLIIQGSALTSLQRLASRQSGEAAWILWAEGRGGGGGGGGGRRLTLKRQAIFPVELSVQLTIVAYTSQVFEPLGYLTASEPLEGVRHSRASSHRMVPRGRVEANLVRSVVRRRQSFHA
jgi:hypothetical protein